MRIFIVTPAPAGSRSGNRVTALRWARMLRALDHQVTLSDQYDGSSADVMIALHARRSSKAAASFRGGRLVVVLTGTDVYGDLPRSKAAQRSLDCADAIIALQPNVFGRLETRWHGKTHVVLQSVPRPASLPSPRKRSFDVCVVGHLRDVKDPMRTAMAARTLPADSRVAVLHVGAALTQAYERRAMAEMRCNQRYRWLGEKPRWQARRIIARSRLLVLSSQMEGGAHVIAEALVAGTPIVCTRIEGTAGQLGDHYPGYFEVGDTAGLSALMRRAESDEAFYRQLVRFGRRLAPQFSPLRERKALQRLMVRLR